MSKLTFDEQQYSSTSRSKLPKNSGLVGWLIKKDWAKNSSQATLILIGIFVVCAVFLAIRYWPGSGNETLTPVEIEQAGGPNDPGIYGS